MLHRIQVTVLMILIAGWSVTGPAGMTDAQGAVENDLLVACSGNCCSSSHRSHQEVGQHDMSPDGSAQGGENPSGALQGQAVRVQQTASGTQTDAKLASLPQELCPVLGGKVDRSVFVDHQGRRIYFCCPACIARFEKEPETYMREMETKGISPERTPGRKEGQTR